MYTRYTKEDLQQVVSAYSSWSEVYAYYDLKVRSSSRSHLRKRAKALGIDTSHLTFKPAIDYIKGHNKLSFDEIFIMGKHVTGVRLRKALIEYGVPYVCLFCKMSATWQDKPLVLQVDHVDGNNCNNLIENLRFLCPNCHSQTETWGYKGKMAS